MSRPGALAGGLGRRVPTDFSHVEKYPLSALPREEQPSHVPMAFGVNWYVNFDSPVKEADGRYWIGRGNLGTIRGGHCICIRSVSQMDTTDWWKFYNQGAEGACVGFGCSRMMSLLNRKRYDARWLWDQAKIVDEWPDTNPGDDNGTSVRAGCDVLRNRGHRRVWGPITFPAVLVGRSRSRGRTPSCSGTIHGHGRRTPRRFVGWNIGRENPWPYGWGFSAFRRRTYAHLHSFARAKTQAA
jgi:hypothetical protein